MPDPHDHDFNLLCAVHLLGAYTAYSYDVWAIAGNAKASCRSHIMSALAGKNVTQSKSGINALRSEFERQTAIIGGCIAERERNFIACCRSMADQARAVYSLHHAA